FAAVGLVEAVQDRHQRRLAGPVLPDDAVDGALLDRKMDIAIGADRAKTLVDADQLDCGFRHPPASFPEGFLSFGQGLARRFSAANRHSSRQHSRQIVRRLSISETMTNPQIAPFTFNTTPSVVFEPGSSKRLGAIAGPR